MLEFLEKYSGNIWTSQNGEDSLIREIVRRLNVKDGHCVEAGAADGLWCSNTALLLRDYGWSGLMVESNHDLYLRCCENWKDNPRVRCQNLAVDESNINSLVDESCDLLSLDTDGPDFLLFQALKVNPKIVIIEIDSSIPPDRRGFNSGGGAGYLEMILLAYQKQFTVLCHTGNLILIRDDLAHLFPELKGTSALSDWELYFNYDVLTGDRKWLDR